MCFKRNIALFIQRAYFHLKNLKLLFWMPLLAVHITVPFIALITLKGSTADNFAANIIEYSILIFPLFSALWTVFILKDYVEGKGNEILYVCKSKNRIADTFFTFILFFITIVLQYLFYIKAESILAPELLRLFCICFFYYSLTYFSMFITKSSALTVLILIGYTVLNFLSIYSNREKVFPLYFDLQLFTKEMFIKQQLPMLAAGIVLLAISYFLNKNMKSFN